MNAVVATPPVSPEQDTRKPVNAPRAADRAGHWSHYAAAAFGALIVGFGDLVHNGDEANAATVLRMAATMREHVSPSLGTGGIALLLLTLIGLGVCFVIRPDSRKEGFTLGFSVFALLSAATPYDKPQNQQSVLQTGTSMLSLIGSAVAQDSVAEKDQPLWTHFFDFDVEASPEDPNPVQVSLFSSDGSQLLDRTVVKDDMLLKYRMPEGEYQMFVECRGCARSRLLVEVAPITQASRIRVEASGWPLGLQKLLSPAVVEVENLTASQVEELSFRPGVLEVDVAGGL